MTERDSRLGDSESEERKSIEMSWKSKGVERVER